MSIWISEVVVLLLGLLIFINGWIIPWLLMGFLLLCLVGQIHEAVQKTSKKSEEEESDRG